MEWFLADCSALLKGNMPVLLSLFLAGLLGSISHCSVMCSPLVATQMLDIQHRKQSQWLMLLYHLGRISTYAALGMLAATAGHWLFAGEMAPFSRLLILLAGAVFIVSAIRPHQTHQCCSKQTSNLLIHIDKLSSPALAYYMRGMLMGFMPCGMIVAALLLVATMDTQFGAALGMALFGLATIPVMQLTGYGSLFLKKHYPNFTTKAGRSVMACNGFLLCGIGLNLVSVN